eukprot:6482336-Amphidinium_carterae.2
MRIGTENLRFQKTWVLFEDKVGSWMTANIVDGALVSSDSEEQVHEIPDDAGVAVTRKRFPRNCHPGVIWNLTPQNSTSRATGTEILFFVC